MPATDKDEHIALAASNLQFLVSAAERVRPRKFDWEVVAIFYAAVHVIEALLASRKPPLHSGSHGDKHPSKTEGKSVGRGWYIRSVLNDRDLFGAHKFLRSESIQARYVMPNVRRRRFRLRHVRKAMEKLRIIKNRCSSISTTILDEAFDNVLQCSDLTSTN